MQSLPESGKAGGTMRRELFEIAYSFPMRTRRWSAEMADVRLRKKAHHAERDGYFVQDPALLPCPDIADRQPAELFFLAGDDPDATRKDSAAVIGPVFEQQPGLVHALSILHIDSGGQW